MSKSIHRVWKDVDIFLDTWDYDENINRSEEFSKVSYDMLINIWKDLKEIGLSKI